MADITRGDESETAQKMDDESRQMQIIWAEVNRNPEASYEPIVDVDMEKCENEGKCTPQGTDEEDQPVIEFEAQAYELTQTYQVEPEYHEMMEEQEVKVVKALNPWEQAEYSELTKLHQREAEMRRK